MNGRTYRREAADLPPIVGEGGKMDGPSGTDILTDEGGAEHDIALHSEMLRIPLTRHGFAVPPSPTKGGGVWPVRIRRKLAVIVLLPARATEVYSPPTQSVVCCKIMIDLLGEK